MLKTCPPIWGGFDALTGKCLRQILARARLSRSRFPKSLSGLAAPDLRALRACTPRLSALRGLGRPAASLPPLTAPSCACGARPPGFNLCFCLFASAINQNHIHALAWTVETGWSCVPPDGAGLCPPSSYPPALRCATALRGSTRRLPPAGCHLHRGGFACPPPVGHLRACTGGPPCALLRKALLAARFQLVAGLLIG